METQQPCIASYTNIYSQHAQAAQHGNLFHSHVRPFMLLKQRPNMHGAQAHGIFFSFPAALQRLATSAASRTEVWPDLTGPTHRPRGPNRITQS